MPPPYRSIMVNDFSGGWVTVTGALALASNQLADILNLIPLPGRLRFRGGYTNVCALPFTADAAFPFYDSAGAKHYAVWAGGNLYDLASGAAVLVVAGVYTAGSRIGTCTLNGVLYWSCGQPHPVVLQYWDPVTPAFGGVPSAGGAGNVNPPASDFLFTYLNCIFALAPTWGAPGPTVYQPTVMTPSAVNDPTKWPAASAQAVGSNNGGKCVFGMQFGIANTGVSPSRQIIVGRSDLGIYSYQGAPPALVENVLNCPVGCLDADTVQYAPMSGLFGSVYFLGTDGQVWQLNGINAAPAANNISDIMINAVAAALKTNPLQRFSSGYNEEWQYYWVDVAGIQYAFRWTTNAWTKFTGWPSGPTFQTTGTAGAPAYYVAGRGTNPKFSQVALDDTADNGVMPVCYATTASLHGGDIRLNKDFQWVTIGTYDTGALYAVSGRSSKRIDGSYMQSQESMLQAPGKATKVAGQFVLGTSVLGGTDVLGGTAPALASGQPVIMQTVLACPVNATLFIPAGYTETLKGNSAQITVRYAGGQPTFDLLSIEVQYVPKGYLGGAGAPYNPTAGAPAGFDPLVAP